MTFKYCVFLSCFITLFFSEISHSESRAFIKPSKWESKSPPYAEGTLFQGEEKNCDYGHLCDATLTNLDAYTLDSALKKLLSLDKKAIKGFGKDAINIIFPDTYQTPLYHAGIDYDFDPTPNDDGDDFAVASNYGVVVKIVRNINGSSEDKGLGNTVILEHNCEIHRECPSSGKIYTQYSHLKSILVDIGSIVYQEDKIGVIGQTGKGKDLWPYRELHFEVKDSPVIGAPNGENLWGYTIKYPDEYGYHDPKKLIGNVFVSFSSKTENNSDQPPLPKDNKTNTKTDQQTTSSGPSPEAITGKQSDLRPAFNVENAAGGEISAVCNTCSSKPVDPGQRIRLRLTAQVANADAGDYKRNKKSKTIEGPIWWQIEGKTGWLLLAGGEYTIGKLDKDENVKETHDWNVPNYPGEILALKACIDGDDEIYEEGESSRTRKITDPDQSGTTNNCSRKERFYIRYPNHDPTGAVESYDCTKVTGWAKDQNTADSLSVQVSVANPDGTNGQPLGTLAANTSRSDLGGNYGFQWTPPASFKDGQPRMVTFTAVNVPEGPNRVIGSVPLTCATDVSAAAIIPIITNVVLADPNLTVVVQGGGTVTSSPKGIDCPGACSESFDGPTVTLAARAKKGSAFVGWVNACGQSKTSASCKLQLNDDRTVTAVFKKIATK